MGKTLEEKLNELPRDQESIEKIRETVKEIQEDIDTTDNQDRKRVLKLNLADCKKLLIERTEIRK